MYKTYNNDQGLNNIFGVVYKTEVDMTQVIKAAPWIDTFGQLNNFALTSYNCPAVKFFDPEQMEQDIDEMFDNMGDSPDPFDAMAYATERYEDHADELAMSMYHQNRADADEFGEYMDY